MVFDSDIIIPCNCYILINFIINLLIKFIKCVASFDALQRYYDLTMQSLLFSGKLDHSNERASMRFTFDEYLIVTQLWV